MLHHFKERKYRLVISLCYASFSCSTWLKEKKAKLHKFCQALKIVVLHQAYHNYLQKQSARPQKLKKSQVLKIVVFFLKPTINLIYKNRVLGSRNYKNHNSQKNPAIPVRKSNIFPISAFRFYQS